VARTPRFAGGRRDIYENPELLRRNFQVCWEKTLQFSREHGIALVYVDEPQGFRHSVQPLAEVTAPVGFVWFHGRNQKAWEQKDVAADEKFRYSYNKPRGWVARVREMARQAEEPHIIFKNKHGDFPVRNAHQFSGMPGDWGVLL
jgi:uncharacterized protein YecE (DUF72 family)